MGYFNSSALQRHLFCLVRGAVYWQKFYEKRQLGLIRLTHAMDIRSVKLFKWKCVYFKEERLLKIIYVHVGKIEINIKVVKIVYWAFKITHKFESIKC